MKDSIKSVCPEESVRTLILYLAQALVDQDDLVRVSLAPDGDDGLTVVLRVSPVDLGKIIGKQGRTARSLRTVLQAVSVKHQHRFTLDIDALPEINASSKSGTGESQQDNSTP